MVRNLAFVGVAAVLIAALAATVFGAQGRPVPIYPDAEDVVGYKWPDEDHFVFLFTTADSSDKVLSFYNTEMSSIGWWGAFPVFKGNLQEQLFCANLTYKESGCNSWHGDTMNKVIVTARGIYHIEVSTIGTASTPGKSYVRVVVSNGKKTWFSCGLCP